MYIAVHICLPIRLYIHQWTGFRENNFFCFQRYVEKIQQSLKSDKKRYSNLYEDLCIFMMIFHTIISNMSIFIDKFA